MEEERKELHVTRIRAKGEPEFFDPGTDIRKVWPAAVNIALDYLKSVYADNKEALEAFDYMYRCFKIFQIRLAEDTAPVYQQVAEYEAAVLKAERKWYQVWRDTVQSMLTAIYALFVRRDIKVDEDELRRMMDYAHLTRWKDVLSNDTFNKIKEELQGSEVIAKREQYEVEDGLAVEAETDRVIQNIKSAAGMFIGSTADMAWNEAADLCDRIFNERVAQGCEDKGTLVPLALAYPSYEHNQLGVVITDGHKGETEQA